MNKKAQVNPKAIGIGIVVVALIYFGYFNSGSFISVPNFVPDYMFQKTDTWLGYNMNIKSTYLGSITSGSSGTSLLDTANPNSKIAICGGNDPNSEVTISNSYSSSSSLILSSSSSVPHRNYGVTTMCDSGNFIEAEIELPKGKLSYYCKSSISVAANEWSNGEAGCIVDGEKITLSCEGDAPRVICKPDVDRVLEKTGTINIDSPRKVKVRIYNKENRDTGASSTLTLDFVEYKDTQQQESSDEETQQDNTQTSDTQQSQVKMSFFDKINNWIANLIQGIQSWF